MNFPLLLSHALIGKTGNKSALWVHPSIRQHLLLYSSLFNIYINILFLNYPITEISTLHPGIYVAQYFL